MQAACHILFGLRMDPEAMRRLLWEMEHRIHIVEVGLEDPMQQYAFYLAKVRVSGAVSSS